MHEMGQNNSTLKVINLTNNVGDYARIYNVAVNRNWKDRTAPNCHGAGERPPLSFIGRVVEDNNNIDIFVSLQTTSGGNIFTGSFKGVVLSRDEHGLVLKSIDATNIKGIPYKLGYSARLAPYELEGSPSIEFFVARVTEDRVRIKR